MLQLEDLSCGYGPMRVVHDLNLDIPPGQITWRCRAQRRRQNLDDHDDHRPHNSAGGPSLSRAKTWAPRLPVAYRVDWHCALA